jgi:hypothetical protein
VRTVVLTHVLARAVLIVWVLSTVAILDAMALLLQYVF